MSGSMMQPMPQQQMPPQMAQGQMAQGMPQRPPQQAQPQPQMPQMPGGAPQPQAMGGPQIVPPVVGGAAAQNPNLSLFAQAAQGQKGQPRLTPAEMGRLGRFGDQVVAHLTPGEIEVPPQLQTPQVLAVLNQAFQHAGVSPQQFMAGSPQSSHNPATGAPEYSLWAALLPILGAAAGSFIPGIGTAAGMAVGGGLGGAAGGLIDKNPTEAALGALGGAAGGYIGGSGGLGSLFGNGAGAATDVAGAATNAAGAGATAAPFGEGIAPGTAGGINGGWDLIPPGGGAATVPPISPASGMNWSQLIKGGLGAGFGAGIAGSLAPQNTQPTAPNGFNTPMNPINPNYGQLLGSGQSNRPFFGGYNPYAAVMGPNPGYNFFPAG